MGHSAALRDGGACSVAARGGRPSVQFSDSVQEFRYEPGSELLPSFSLLRDPAAVSVEKEDAEWCAGTAMHSEKCFYAPLHSYSWQHPGDAAASPEGQELSVGDGAEVFGPSKQVWCSGYIEWHGVVQLPGGYTSHWIKKDCDPLRPDARWPDGSPLTFGSPEPVSPPAASAAEDRPMSWSSTACKPGRFYETELPKNWTAEELRLYDRLFAEMDRSADGSLDAEQLVRHFGEAGLRQKVLKGIWQVGNPELRESAGLEEFRAFCRLAGHCQAFADAAAGRKPEAWALKRGGGPLRALLRDCCLALPPPKLLQLGRGQGAGGAGR